MLKIKIKLQPANRHTEGGVGVVVIGSHVCLLVLKCSL
jgi:hypothetical protein